MDVHGVLDHLVGWYALVLVFRMRYARVGQVERGIELLGGHRRVGGIHHHVDVARLLKQALGMYLVGFLLDMPVVLGFGLFVSQAFFV